ncbi:hypothetical protein IT575_02210 [bacterium]|nr:hypothetical protein [bacterium]
MNLHKCEEFGGCWPVLVDGGSETLNQWLSTCSLDEWSGLLSSLQLLSDQADLRINLEAYNPICVQVPQSRNNLLFTSAGTKCLVFFLGQNHLVVLGIELLENGYPSKAAVKKFETNAEKALGTLDDQIASQDL